MSLHGLLSVTIGVPNVEETAAYYTDFGLTPAAGGWFSTADGGPQLRIVHTPTRRLVELHVAADDADDLGRAAVSLARLGLAGQLSGVGLATIEPVTGTRVYLDIAPRLHQEPPTATAYNGPGRFDRTSNRAPGFMRPNRVRPRKLGHTVLGSVDYRATMAFFVDGLGFKVSDRIKDAGAFMRCSTDHHNILVLSAPVNFLHHTSWQVDDIDDVGRGAYAMLEGHPERHVWVSAATSPGRTSSGISRIRPATSPSITRTWTASSMTSCGRRRIWKAHAASSPGVPHRRRRSCTPRTWPH